MTDFQITKTATNNRLEQNKWLSFILSISKKELAMNGWIDDDPRLILKIYQTFASFTKKGNYLELGCGTGILAKFINLSSGNKIIPHGVDCDINSVEIAKKNNPEYANNFIQLDYFRYLELNSDYLNKFSSICIFVNSNIQEWKRLKEILVPIIKECESTNFIIVCYDYNLLKMEIIEISDFIIEMKKLTTVSIASNSVIVIGKNTKIHETASQLRANLQMKQ